MHRSQHMYGGKKFMRKTTCGHTRMANELKTIAAMLALYCRHHHRSVTGELCAECRQLYEYAEKRLALCPFQEEKPTCGNCSIHCYKKDMRDKVRAVMQYAGPRMICRHPLMALRHLLDGRRRIPAQSDQKKNSS